MKKLRFVKMSENEAIKAVERNGDALQFVEIKSEEIYKTATFYKEEYGIAFGFRRTR